MNVIPADALLTRDQTAAALAAAGFPVKSKTLATKASRGGGPPYQLFGPRVLYRWSDALKWAEARLTAPRRSTSESDASILGAGERCQTCVEQSKQLAAKAPARREGRRAGFPRVGMRPRRGTRNATYKLPG